MRIVFLNFAIPGERDISFDAFPMQIPADILTQCWFLAGPTASGKTAVGIELAARINAEIVCLDSMTIYRRMDIGTAKPTASEQARCRHHLLDIIEPHQEFSVADYLAAAKAACQEILNRGKTPLFVGGTGLYLRSALRGVFQGPPADWELRGKLESLGKMHGDLWLHERLALVDPQSAARLHPRDRRRIIRALEVHELTGRPLSEQQQQPALAKELRPSHVYWLSPLRDWLYQRIDDRVQEMSAAGLLAEVRALRNLPQPLSRTARQALGYKEVFDWLEASGDDGSSSLPAKVISEIQLRTRQFAKRQHTWFRNLEECRAIPLHGGESAEELAEQICGHQVP
jgi:tRNA dimethylallyltransferase